MSVRQTISITRYSARYSVRGGIGLIFLLLSLTFGLTVAHLMLQPVEMASKEIHDRMPNAKTEVVTEQVLDELVGLCFPVVSWALRTDAQESEDENDLAEERANNWASYLLEDKPALLSAIFLILLIGWPLIVSFGAFDLYAGDIGSRQLRYQLLRADRASIYFGRLLGALLTFFIVLFMLALTVSTYMGAKLSVYNWGDLLTWALYSTMALGVATLPYVALCAWISASLSSSFASLTVTSLVIGGVPLIAILARQSYEPAGYINYLLPWGFQVRLFHNEPAQVALACGGCGLQAAVFTWLGYRKFTRRDL